MFATWRFIFAYHYGLKIRVFIRTSFQWSCYRCNSVDVAGSDNVVCPGIVVRSNSVVEFDAFVIFENGSEFDGDGFFDAYRFFLIDRSFTAFSISTARLTCKLFPLLLTAEYPEFAVLIDTLVFLKSSRSAVIVDRSRFS